MELNEQQFGRYTVRVNPLAYRQVEAIHTASGKKVGQLSWEKGREEGGEQVPPKILHADVLARHQRKGIGTEMVKMAAQVEPNLRHSHALTEPGKALARKVPLG